MDSWSPSTSKSDTISGSFSSVDSSKSLFNAEADSLLIRKIRHREKERSRHHQMVEALSELNRQVPGHREKETQMNTLKRAARYCLFMTTIAESLSLNQTYNDLGDDVLEFVDYYRHASDTVNSWTKQFVEEKHPELVGGNRMEQELNYSQFLTSEAQEACFVQLLPFVDGLNLDASPANECQGSSQGLTDVCFEDGNGTGANLYQDFFSSPFQPYSSTSLSTVSAASSSHHMSYRQITSTPVSVFGKPVTEQSDLIDLTESPVILSVNEEDNSKSYIEMREETGYTATEARAETTDMVYQQIKTNGGRVDGDVIKITGKRKAAPTPTDENGVDYQKENQEPSSSHGLESGSVSKWLSPENDHCLPLKKRFKVIMFSCSNNVPEIRTPVEDMNSCLQPLDADLKLRRKLFA